jgi:hypothetical protein
LQATVRGVDAGLDELIKRLRSQAAERKGRKP